LFSVPNLADDPDVVAGIKIDQDLATKEESITAALNRLQSTQNRQEDRAVRSAALARGENPGPAKSTASQVADLMADRQDVRKAREIRFEENAKMMREKGAKIRESQRPAVQAQEKRFAVAFNEAIEALLARKRIMDGLGRQGLGWEGAPCSLDVGQVFSSLDRASDAAQLLRKAVSLGYLKSIPEWK